MKNMKKKIGLRRFLLVLLILALVSGLTVLIMNVVMLRTTAGCILSADEAPGLDADCVIVLGAGVRDDGTPSHILRDRIDTGVLLYAAGAAPKLLMSGDHGRVEYDEVNVMRSYALDARGTIGRYLYGPRWVFHLRQSLPGQRCLRSQTGDYRHAGLSFAAGAVYC